MATENSEQVARARDLINRTRRELVRMQEDIAAARTVIDQSRKILSRTEPASDR